MGRPNFNPLRDVLSGVIMAATSVPQLIAYAETSGYAGYRGLATAGPPLFAWGIATGSPFMNAGVTSLTALMAKTDLDGESYVLQHGEEKYVQLMAAYSLYVGMSSIFLALIGFGKLAQNVPKPVRTGFKWGCSVGILASAVSNGFFGGGSTQLKQLVSDAGGDLYASLLPQLKSNFPGAVNVIGFLYALTHPWEWTLLPTIIFVFGTAFVMQGSTILPKFLPPGTEVIIVTAAATLYSMNYTYAGAVVGQIPSLDPDAGISLFGGTISLPIQLYDIRSLLTEVPILEQFGNSWFKLLLTATIFSGVNFLSIVGIASGFETEDGISWSAPREMLAQAFSNFVAGAVGSAPVSGSLSRSLVSRMTGTTSQLACLVTSLCWIYCLPYMNIMSPTPKAALSAIIVSAVVKPVLLPKDLNQLRGIYKIVGWATGIITCITSPTQGFGFGLILYYSLRFLFESSASDDDKKTK